MKYGDIQKLRDAGLINGNPHRVLAARREQALAA